MFLNNFKELILNNTSASFIKFFYGLTHIQIQNIRFENNQLQIDACSKYKSAHCNCCGKKSYTKRGSYTRKITELPLAEYRVVINIRVYKYQCKNSKCTKKIFSQQIKNFTYRYGRRSLKANEYIKKICLEISAQKASYFSKILKIPLSSSTCLRLVRNMPINVSDNLSCIGIDDWAKRKGMTYGSIIVDSITRQTIDLIDSRSKSDVANWLKTHPSISLVTRDRSRTYASAITKALPKAKQIADKFHIVKNLSEAIYEELKCLFKEIKYVYNRMIRIESRENTICKIVSDEQIYKTTREARKNKYKQYKQLYDSGLKISEIARKTGSHRQTVSRYLHNGIPSIINKNRLNYDSYLTEIHAMIKKEFNSTLIYKHLKRKGFQGCSRSFTRWFKKRFPNYKYKNNRNSNQSKIEENHQEHLPRIKQFTILLLNKEYGISKKIEEINQKRKCVNNLISKIPFLKEFQEIYTTFRNVINGKSIVALNQWYNNNITKKYKHIKSFCNGLKKDWEAVCNAILFDWNNGILEGSVNRLKAKKREMYGRGGYEILRRKVCLSVTG